jgi:hypothetical protein
MMTSRSQPAREQRVQFIWNLYLARLSRLESLCAFCDMQSRIARPEQFQAKRQSFDEEMRPIKAIDRRHDSMLAKVLLRVSGDAPKRITNARLPARRDLYRDWRGDLCRHGALR